MTDHRGVVWYVAWVDAAGQNHGAWTPLDDSMNIARCISAGFLVRDEPDFIVLAGSLDVQDNACDLMAIPRVAITEMKAWSHEESA